MVLVPAGFVKQADDRISGRVQSRISISALKRISISALKTSNFCHPYANLLRKMTTDITDHANFRCRLDCDRNVLSVAIREIRGEIPWVAAESRDKR